MGATRINLERLLERIARSPNPVFSGDEKEKMGALGMYLEKEKIIARGAPADSVMLPEYALGRGDSLLHEVLRDKKGKEFVEYYDMESGNMEREYLPDGHSDTWILGVESFLQWLGQNLKILNSRIKPLIPENLWFLGVEDVCSIYFAREMSRPETEKAVEGGGNLLILPTLEQMQQYPENAIALETLLSFNGEKIVANVRLFRSKMKQRRLFFDAKTGEIKIDGKNKGYLAIGSSHFYFFLILFKKYETPVSHSDIYAYVKEETAKNYSSTAQEFCNKQKSTICKKIPEMNEFLHARENAYVLIG